MKGYAFPVLSNSLTEWVLGNSSDRHSLCLPCPTVLKQGGTGGLLQSTGRGQLLHMIACQCALARFSYTRSRLASLARFLFVGQSDVRLRSLLQGTRVTYVTETLFLTEEIPASPLILLFFFFFLLKPDKN